MTDCSILPLYCNDSQSSPSSPQSQTKRAGISTVSSIRLKQISNSHQSSVIPGESKKKRKKRLKRLARKRKELVEQQERLQQHELPEQEEPGDQVSKTLIGPTPPLHVQNDDEENHFMTTPKLRLKISIPVGLRRRLSPDAEDTFDSAAASNSHNNVDSAFVSQSPSKEETRRTTAIAISGSDEEISSITSTVVAVDDLTCSSPPLAPNPTTRIVLENSPSLLHLTAALSTATQSSNNSFPLSDRSSQSIVSNDEDITSCDSVILNAYERIDMRSSIHNENVIPPDFHDQSPLAFKAPPERELSSTLPTICEDMKEIWRKRSRHPKQRHKRYGFVLQQQQQEESLSHAHELLVASAVETSIVPPSKNVDKLNDTQFTLSQPFEQELSAPSYSTTSLSSLIPGSVLGGTRSEKKVRNKMLLKRRAALDFGTLAAIVPELEVAGDKRPIEREYDKHTFDRHQKSNFLCQDAASSMKRNSVAAHLREHQEADLDAAYTNGIIMRPLKKRRQFHAASAALGMNPFAQITDKFSKHADVVEQNKIIEIATESHNPSFTSENFQSIIQQKRPTLISTASLDSLAMQVACPKLKMHVSARSTLRGDDSLTLEPLLPLKPLFPNIQDTVKRNTPELFSDNNDEADIHIQQLQPQRKINPLETFLKHQAATAAALLEPAKGTLSIEPSNIKVYNSSIATNSTLSTKKSAAAAVSKPNNLQDLRQRLVKKFTLKPNRNVNNPQSQLQPQLTNNNKKNMASRNIIKNEQELQPLVAKQANAGNIQRRNKMNRSQKRQKPQQHENELESSKVSEVKADTFEPLEAITKSNEQISQKQPSASKKKASSPWPYYDDDKMQASSDEWNSDDADEFDCSYDSDASSSSTNSLNKNQWVRRSIRQPCQDLLQKPHIKSCITKLKKNADDMVVCKLKVWLSPDTPMLVMDAVLDALDNNTNCQSLYIQNFNEGMRDKQVLRLLTILKKGHIWCINIGETYKVRSKTWEKFARGLRKTNVTHMYASEHTIDTELKDKIRGIIRQNRMKHRLHISPDNLDVIVQCTHCWWNPINAKALQPVLKASRGKYEKWLDADVQGLPSPEKSSNPPDEGESIDDTYEF